MLPVPELVEGPKRCLLGVAGSGFFRLFGLARGSQSTPRPKMPAEPRAPITSASPTDACRTPAMGPIEPEGGEGFTWNTRVSSGLSAGGPYQLMRPERRRTSIPTPKAAMTAKILPSSTLPAVNCNAEHAANNAEAAANSSCGMSFFPISTV